MGSLPDLPDMLKETHGKLTGLPSHMRILKELWFLAVIAGVVDIHVFSDTTINSTLATGDGQWLQVIACKLVVCNS